MQVWSYCIHTLFATARDKIRIYGMAQRFEPTWSAKRKQQHCFENTKHLIKQMCKKNEPHSMYVSGCGLYWRPAGFVVLHARSVKQERYIPPRLEQASLPCTRLCICKRLWPAWGSQVGVLHVSWFCAYFCTVQENQSVQNSHPQQRKVWQIRWPVSVMPHVPLLQNSKLNQYWHPSA